MASITSSHDTLRGVYLPGNPPSTKWDIHCDDGRISSIVESGKGSGQFAIPSLCHPHIHLDKAYLLSHPNYSDLQVKSGDFFEALSLTGIPLISVRLVQRGFSRIFLVKVKLRSDAH